MISYSFQIFQHLAKDHQYLPQFQLVFKVLDQNSFQSLL